MNVTEIRVADCVPFENYPFKIQDNSDMEMLIDSIKESGVLIPIVVRPKGKEDAEQFADLLERYGDITELTPEILNMLVDKIMVYEPRAVDGVMRQQIDVYYRYIGVVKLVDYGSTTYYKSGEVLTAAKKRENAKMEKRIAAVKEEMQSDEAVSA